MGNISRSMAFRIIIVFLFGTFIGSTMPEWGNVIAYIMGYRGAETHIFNPVFLVIGIIGIVLACVFGYKQRRRKS